MVIDLILDRREIEEDKAVSVADCKLGELWVPILDCFEEDIVPEDLRKCYTYKYTPHGFYIEVMGYGDVGEDITRAMDFGEEADVKRALCDYIDRQEYNPNIKDYINSVNWL